MATTVLGPGISYQQRLAALRTRKLAQTREKQTIFGAMNYDDWALVLPPPDKREIVQTISPSGVPITDSLLAGVHMASNHPSGGFFGPRLVGENFRRLLTNHPVYLDPLSSLAGAYMVNFSSYCPVQWNPDYHYDHLREAQERYQLVTGIGGKQHFAQDLTIGLRLGWGGLLQEIRRYRAENPPDTAAYYDGLEHVVLGVQDWIARHASAAREQAALEPDTSWRENLAQIAAMNERLVDAPPTTFREACQWIVWYQMTARMFNGSGSLGRLDAVLWPYYDRDTRQGILDDDEAIFHIACLLLRDTAYIQLGGPDEHGVDTTNPVSFLILEAVHRLKIPANVGVAVGESCDPRLLRRGVEILLEDKLGIPKFLGVEQTAAGFARNGYAIELGRQRDYNGCHWLAIPGREYGMNDMIKVSLPAIFDVALREMLAGPAADRGVSDLWRLFAEHLRRAVDTVAGGIDVHMEHMHEVFPELVLSLLCHGPIEKGRDACNGGVEFYNLGVDAVGLANVANAFAAVECRVERERRLTWDDLLRHLDADWADQDGERARLMMKSVPGFGSGGSSADEYAVRVSQLFTRFVTDKPTPHGYRMIPGLFSWASMIDFGKKLGATPDGRHAGTPIAQGANPAPGFRKDGAPTALAAAVAAVQPGYGNTAPLQIDLEPTLVGEAGAIDLVISLIKSHFALGGAQINMNVLDKQKILEAHRDPSKYPDLIVRVTGFSAYFASLSPEFRQIVVDRIVAMA